MKNTHLGKTLTQILSVLLCATVVIMIACCFHPYFSIEKPYHFILNPNPKTDYYSLIDVMWCNTQPQDDGNMNVSTDFSVDIIRNHFEEQYSNFDFNKYITNMVLSFIFALATVATSVWFAFNEYKHYPSMTSGVFSHIAAFGYTLFGMLGYASNDMLSLSVPAFAYVRTLIVIVLAVGLLLTIARFVVWLLTTIQLAKERKARLALL